MDGACSTGQFLVYAGNVSSGCGWRGSAGTGSEEPLRLSSRSFSQSQSVLIDGTLRLFPVGTVNYATAQPICSLKLPKGVSDWMIVIFGSGGENQQFRMIPVVDREFLMGSVHFLNASKFPIGGIIDGDAFKFRPAGSTITRTHQNVPTEFESASILLTVIRTNGSV